MQRNSYFPSINHTTPISPIDTCFSLSLRLKKKCGLQIRYWVRVVTTNSLLIIIMRMTIPLPLRRSLMASVLIPV
ncbi:hypothetical protein, partial [Akkermansia massiliensis]|uniref:hypothetical protein n=1 Tax=Akkermansia massiliensis TaxID=2927224 RepID=UPI00202FDFB2